MLDNFEKAETLSFLWERHRADDRAGRGRGHPGATATFTCVLPTVLSVDDIREYAAASEMPLTADEQAQVEALWSRNFDHVDRYVMPLKSSV